MPCKEYLKNGWLYIFNELEAREKKVFDRHLQGCPDCQKELSAMRQMLQIYESLPDEEPSPAILEKILKPARNRKTSIRPWYPSIWDMLHSHWRPAVAGGLGILMAFMLGYFIFVIEKDSLPKTSIDSWDDGLESRLSVISERVDELKFEIHEGNPDRPLFPWLSTTDIKLRQVSEDMDVLSRELENL